MVRQVFITLLLLLPLTANSQYLPLWHSAQGDCLDLNIDRIWSYNLYEHSRWGAGIRYTRAPRKTAGTLVWLDSYVGYGVFDRQWKGGLEGAIRYGRNSHGLTQFIRISRDYHVAGSRSLTSATLTDPMSLAGFMNRRMIDRVSLDMGSLWRTDCTKQRIEMSIGIGNRLFYNEQLLYRTAGDTLTKENHLMLRWLMQLPQGVSSQVEVGTVWPQQRYVARLLTQYDRTFSFTHSHLQTFAQAGITPPHTPYTYLFNLGGTWGAPVSFRNSLLTARPNEFAANTFLFLSLRFALSRPLVEAWNRTLQLGTAPRPFVGLNAAWGHLWHQDPLGRLTHEGLELQAPLQGLVEPVVGVEGIIRWGVVDWGMAVAYRLVPPAAPYRLETSQANLALLITASLIFQ